MPTLEYPAGTHHDVAALLALETLLPWEYDPVGCHFPKNEDITDAVKAEAVAKLLEAGLNNPPRPYRVYMARFIEWHHRLPAQCSIADTFACGCVAWTRSNHPPSANTLTSFYSAVCRVWPTVATARDTVNLCRQWLTLRGDGPDSAPKVVIKPDESQLAIWLMHAGDGYGFLAVRRRMVARLACLPGMGYSRMVALTWGDVERVNHAQPVYEVVIGSRKQLIHARTPAAFDIHAYCEAIKRSHKEVWGKEPGKAFPLIVRVKGDEPVVAWNGKMPTPLHATTIRGILRRMGDR